MQSVCNGSQQNTEFDIIASNKNFIEKMGQRWFAIAGTYDIESSSYLSNARKKSNEVNDSLDVCSYRAIQNYAVNKVSNFAGGADLNGNTNVDMFDPDGNQYFFDQSNNDVAIVNMEDTLDICSYRRSIRNNLTNILNDQEESTLVYHDVIAENSFNKSTIDGQHMNELELDKSILKMEDTLDVCSYRRRSTIQLLTPVRYNPWISSFFNRYLVPFEHFSPSPIHLTSSPNSSFVAQFSDQSDGSFNLSSE